MSLILQKKLRLGVEIGYLILLGVTLGAVLTLGIFVASTIFNSEQYLTSVILSHYDQGILMSAIFNKFNFFLSFVVLIIMLYEGYDYKSAKRDKIVMLFAFLIVVFSLLFVGYYTPIILELQAQGVDATQSEIFRNNHIASEIIFKFLAFSLLMLLGRRLFLMRL